MKLAGLLAVLGAVGIAAGILAFVFTDSTDAPENASVIATPTRDAVPSPTPLPETWLSAFIGVDGAAVPELISCRDGNGDARLNAADDLGVMDVTLIPGEVCVSPQEHADYYGDPIDQIAQSCESGGEALLVVVVASAGSDLLAPSEGESLGLIDIVNALRARADRDSGTATWLIVSTAAIFGAEQPQTSMERWLEREMAERLDAAPCLRAVVIGHSHGGATVTSVTSALEGAYGDRLLAVLIDRTTALYDRPAAEMPVSTPILNFFQLNEGWHGVAIDAPNVRNFDESTERAPVAPSDGGGGLALVSHKTLDDAPNTQQRVVDEILAWAVQ